MMMNDDKWRGYLDVEKCIYLCMVDVVLLNWKRRSIGQLKSFHARKQKKERKKETMQNK